MGTNALRTCTGCNFKAYTKQELNSFVKCTKHCYDRKNFCNECEKKRGKDYRKRNPETVLLKRQQYYATKVYNTTLEKYQERMASSDKCQVCGSKDKLCYDHDHKTMEFRGVLCNKCNRSIGILGDTLESIEKVLIYLKGNNNANIQ
tara:strand:+ start:975 stop:1415 length:441 start_codon:yes stop_codon:yes gene_type:complete